MKPDEIDRIGVTIDSPHIEEQKQRLAALLLTLPTWTQNYTVSVDAAGWLIAEARRVGWILSTENAR